MTTKESHEGVRERQESLVKGFQGAFTTERVAEQDDQKIDGVILPKTGAGEPDLLLDGLKQAQMGQNLSEGCSFSHPGWG